MDLSQALHVVICKSLLLKLSWRIWVGLSENQVWKQHGCLDPVGLRDKTQQSVQIERRAHSGCGEVGKFTLIKRVGVWISEEAPKTEG